MFFRTWGQVQADPKYNITYRILTQEDGLASHNVNAGLQDSRGFIWLGTRDGLNRYNGSQFQLFTKEKNRLQANNVVDLCEDADQKLWILFGLPGVNTTSAGMIDILDITTGSVTSFNDYFKSPPFKQTEVVGMAVSNSHELFIYCRSGLVYLYKGKGHFKTLNLNHRLTERGTHFVFINHATDSGLWLRYDHLLSRSGRLTTAPKYDEGYQAMCFEGEDEILLMYLGPERRLSYDQLKIVSVSGRGLEEYRGRMSEETRRTFYKICKEDFFMVLRDNKSGSSLVYPTGKNIYLYRNGELITIFDSTQMRKVPSMGISDVFTDDEGKLWVCSSAGLMVFKIAHNRFTHYLNSAENKLSGERTDYQTRGIAADTNGNIFVSGTTGAYHIYDRGGTTTLHHLGTDVYTSPMLCDGRYCYFGHINMHKYDLQTKADLTIFSVDGYDIIWNAYKIGDKRWWLSNRSDFFFVREKVFRPITYKESGDTLRDVWIHQFYKDRKGRFWAIGSKGLFQMENDSEARYHWGSNEKDPKFRLPFDDFHNIWEDEENNFWMASNGDGLYKWERKQNKFLHFTIADGLSSNLLYAILGDEKGYLWISTDNGLMRFSTKDFSVKTYTANDGLTNNEFNRLSYFKAADGRMFFGSIDGVNAFYPRDFWNDSTAFDAPLQITSYTQFKASVDRLEDLTANVVLEKNIILEPGDNFFTIDFALLDFETGKHRYAYKIEGIDNDWNYIDNNSIRISRPPYGSYLLKIKGQNSEGQWSSSELSIPLEVIMPFYWQKWFLISALLLIILIVFAYIRFRVWQYRRRNRALEKVVAERTNELRNSLQQKEILLKEIHHRVKNNLQVISSLLQLQSRSIKDETAKQALLEGHNRVLSIALIHQKLYQNDDVSIVELSSFANELFAQVHGVLSREISVRFENQLPHLLFNIDIALPLGLILNELMTNVFKYALNDNTNPVITLNISRVPGYLILRFADNGPGIRGGFNPTEANTLGIRLISRLGKQLNGKVEYITDGGAAFDIYIPGDEEKKG